MSVILLNLFVVINVGCFCFLNLCLFLIVFTAAGHKLTASVFIAFARMGATITTASNAAPRETHPQI